MARLDHHQVGGDLRSLAQDHVRPVLDLLGVVEGLFADWPDRSSLIAEIRASELADLLSTLDSGMAPKMEACLRAVESGVGAVVAAESGMTGAPSSASL